MTKPSDEPIQFQVGEETWALRLGFGAICHLERTFDKPFRTIAAEVFGPDMRMDDFLTVFHACLLRENSRAYSQADLTTEDITRDEAAAAIDLLGIGYVGELVGKAVEQCPLFAEKPKPPKPAVRGAGEGKKRAAAG